LSGGVERLENISATISEFVTTPYQYCTVGCPYESKSCVETTDLLAQSAFNCQTWLTPDE